MPEGPEIRRVAHRLGRVLAQNDLQQVWFRFPQLEVQAEGLQRSGIKAVRSWGKALLMEFNDGRMLYSHNQLYGRWYVRKAGQRPSTTRELRVVLETSRHAALLYSASEIEILEAGAWQAHRFLSRLGPDVFATGTTPALLRRRLQRPAFRGRQLGALLLDQSYVAGLGNYLRSEILFDTHLHPQLRPKDLDAAQLGSLTRSIRAMARRAYDTGGYTAPAARVRRLRAQGYSRAASRHLVFGRAGQDCPRCSVEIQRISHGGRRLYLCPACQPTGTAHDC